MDPIENPETKINEPTTDESDVNGGPSLTTWLVIGGLAVVGVALLAVFFSGSDSTPTAAAEGDGGIAGLVFTNEDGTDGTLADYEGEPLVVNFFASWCAPCRAELPDFQQVHVESEGRVQFVGVNHDIDESSWLSFVDEVDLTYPTVFQPEQEIWETLNLFGMPATALVTPEGEVVFTFSGVLDQESLKEAIAEHLNVEV
ncbi:MAG: TlpA family protein disulfide reductase [Acidimicrobiia bacterium]|nr:TlpA family protein disulfide reductase [Acidimicrobiia bacterium]